MRTWIALGCVAVLASCRSFTASPHPGGEETASDSVAPASCEGLRVAANLMVFAVDGMEEPEARRIEAGLADELGTDVLVVVADPAIDLVTLLASSDADVTAAETLDALRTLGFEAREGDEREYRASRENLASRTLTIPATVGAADRSNLRGSSLPIVQSLEDSLDPLRDQFNHDEGSLRVIAVLSPT